MKKIRYFLGNVPDSNLECEDIEHMLSSLGVKFETRDVFKQDNMFLRIYKIPETEAEKLPRDEKGVYLPVDETSGHGLVLDVSGKLWKHYLANEFRVRKK